MDIRFHLGWMPAVELLDEEAAKLYVENPVAGALYTRVDVQIEMRSQIFEIMESCDTGGYIDRLANYERSLYFLPFTDEIVQKRWYEDLGLVGKNPTWRSYLVTKVVHGVTLL